MTADFVIWRGQTPGAPWDWYKEYIAAYWTWYGRAYEYPQFCYVPVGTVMQVSYLNEHSITIPTLGTTDSPPLFNGIVPIWACPAVAPGTLWIGAVPPAEFPLP